MRIIGKNHIIVKDVIRKITNNSGEEMANLAINLYNEIRTKAHIDRLRILAGTTALYDDSIFTILFPGKVLLRFLHGKTHVRICYYDSYWRIDDNTEHFVELELGDSKTIDTIIEIFKENKHRRGGKWKKRFGLMLTDQEERMQGKTNGSLHTA